MAKEHRNVSNLTVEILKGIRVDLQGLRGDVGEVKAELSAVKAEISAVKAEVSDLKTELRTGLDEVRAGLHELADSTQAGFKAVLAQGDRRFLDHEGRLRRLEAHAGFEPGS